MRKIILSISSLIIITAAFFTACNKEDNCNSCSKPADAIEQVTFNLLPESFSADFKIWKLDINGNYRESLGSKTDENLFQLIKKYCISKNITLENQLMAVVLYYDLPLSESLTVSDEHIKGISLYEVKGYRITHRLYVRNETNDFVEEENVKVAVSGIITSHIDFYHENYVFTEPQNKSDITFSGDLAVKVWKNLRKYKVPMQYEVRQENHSDVEPTPTRKPMCGGKCIYVQYNAGCYWHKDTWTYICVDEGGGSGGGGGICATEMVAFETAGRGCQAYIDMRLMYSFRDDVLSVSAKGVEYINNYYYLSDEYQGKMTVDLAVQTALVLKDFNPVMSAFLDPNTPASEIMIDEELSDDILKLLNEYEKITTSKEGKDILNSIRQDISMVKNKTLAEIHTLYQ